MGRTTKKRPAVFEKLFLFFFYGICFLLPFQPRFLATVEIATVLLFLLAYPPLDIARQIAARWKVFLPFAAFFAVIALSYFYSEDKTEAGRQIEVKLAFLIIPLLILGSGMRREKSKMGLICFIAGCTSACLVLIAWAAASYWKYGDSAVFVYTDFSRFMHVSYFSMYLLIGFGWLFMVAMEDTLFFPRLHYAIMALYAVCLVLISAKIMLIAFVVSSFLFAAYYARRRKKIAAAVALVILICTAPVILYFLSPNLKVRVDFFLTELRRHDTDMNPQSMGSATIRMVIWKDALPQIKENLPWGVGAGDVQTLLQENFRKRNMAEAIEKRLNMHNEYLQLLGGVGILGMLLYVFLVALPARLCAPPRRFIGILFSFTVFTVSLTESILERQAGTIFICLLGLLLITAYEKERPAVPNS